MGHYPSHLGEAPLISKLKYNSGATINRRSYDDEQTEDVCRGSHVDHHFDSARRLVAYNGGG